MNETTQTIRTRRTANFFKSDPVPEEVIAEALECAVRAPNHKLTNPWRFTRVGPKTRAALVENSVTVKREGGPMSEAQERKVREKASSSPELFVVSQIAEADEFRKREDYAACACAIQNFCLALWSLGVRSKWGTGGVTRDSRTYRILGIDPADEEIIGFVYVGFADTPIQTSRTPVQTVLRTTA